MKKRLGVAFLDQVEFEHLVGKLRLHNRSFEADVAIHERPGREIRGSLGFLVYDRAICFVSRLSRGKKAGDTRRNFHAEHTVPVDPPLPIDQIASRLLDSQREATFSPGGTLTEKASALAIDLLSAERPQLIPVIDEILALDTVNISNPDQVPLIQQRDAVATLLDIAGFDAPQPWVDDRSWLAGDRRTFLP